MAGNLSTYQQSDFLAGVDLFKRLPESCLNLLVKDSRVLDCAAGHLFFQAGELGNSLFVLEKGHVRTFRSYGDKTLTIARIEPPAIFGEMGCFGQGKYYFSAEALHDSRVRLISRDSIEGLLECAPRAAHKFIDLMSERCEHILRKIETIAHKGLILRVATLLLEKAEDGVVVGMTHALLAEQLGLHRESITVALGQLQKAGMIRIERKKISILQRDRLQRAR
jgi:CRP/FNR family cyclic AMP-dependent transcriptional regulator